ncbi:MAG: hypothetical protein ABIP68_04280 [Ferruginibacter sp.]
MTYLQSNGQPVPKECYNPIISHQADSLKSIFLSDGFMVIRESPLKMESEYEFPIIVNLNKGNWYHFIFVGDKTSNLFELVMYDWDENKVHYEKNKKKDNNGNIISFSFVGSQTGYHILKPLQINKKVKNLCGYFIMMSKIK